MTNDILHASIAAALVQADLMFTTVLGTSGERIVRLFELDFDLARAGGHCIVTGYVTPPLLVVQAPVRVRASKRQDIGDALARTIPMVRLVPDHREKPGTEYVTAWVEASVPVPAGEQAPSPNLAAPPWLTLPAFMGVPSGVDFIVATFPGDASVPTERISVPMFAAERTPSVGATRAAAPPNG